MELLFLFLSNKFLNFVIQAFNFFIFEKNTNVYGNLIKNASLVFSVYLERFLQVTVVWLFLTCNFSFAFPLWILFIAKPQFFHLVLLSWAIGYALGRIRTRSVDEAGYLLHAAISTSFFYMVDPTCKITPNFKFLIEFV